MTYRVDAHQVKLGEEWLHGSTMLNTKVGVVETRSPATRRWVTNFIEIECSHSNGADRSLTMIEGASAPPVVHRQPGSTNKTQDAKNGRT